MLINSHVMRPAWSSRELAFGEMVTGSSAARYFTASWGSMSVAQTGGAAGGGDGGREAGDKSWGEIINCHSA